MYDIVYCFLLQQEMLDNESLPKPMDSEEPDPVAGVTQDEGTSQLRDMLHECITLFDAVSIFDYRYTYSAPCIIKSLTRGHPLL